jgi:hypothetical protein
VYIVYINSNMPIIGRNFFMFLKIVRFTV